MAKPEKSADKAPEMKSDAPGPMTKVRLRFTAAHTHAGLPFVAGDEITIESHWADSIERLGTGHRITDNEPKE